MTMILRTGVTTLNLVLSALAFLLVFCLVKSLGPRRPKGLRYPPGPPGKPIIGNARDLPSHHDWETFTIWAKQYGGLVYVKAFGQPIVIVNSLDVAQDLFEKRSLVYSDRIHFPMLLDLMGWGWSFGFMPYGKRWQRHRTIFHQKFHSAAAAAYYPIQTNQTSALLQRLQQSPDHFVRHFRNHVGAIIMEVVYGIKVLPIGDPYIDIAEKAMGALAVAGIPGTFLIDYVPILKYVPEWMPGAGFKKKARIWRKSIIDMPAAPFQAVKEAINAGTAKPSVTASLLEGLPMDAPADEQDVIRDSVGMAYAAGSDTMVVAMTTFILAMVLYPEAQRKAQAELDSFLGMGQLPDFEDRASLPYVNSLCKEVLRWHPVTPVGVPHRLMENDVYGDYFIPKGSLIIGNAWAMLRDPNMYGPEPDKFRPERFLVPGVCEPTISWGFGRRICPGRYFAENTIFITVASILKVFNISPATDNNGKEIPVQELYTSEFASRPEPFSCEIKSRSASAQALFSKHADN